MPFELQSVVAPDNQLPRRSPRPKTQAFQNSPGPGIRRGYLPNKVSIGTPNQTTKSRQNHKTLGWADMAWVARQKTWAYSSGLARGRLDDKNRISLPHSFAEKHHGLRKG